MATLIEPPVEPEVTPVEPEVTPEKTSVTITTSSEQIEGPEIISAPRSPVTVTKASFCMALEKVGVLSFTEALSAAKGNWPTTFTPPLRSLPIEAQRDAQILWAAVTEIRRDAPLISLLQAYLKWTPEQVDVLFNG